MESKGNDTKVITYIGKERCDIIYFLALAGEKTGKRILILDNSTLQDLFGVYKEGTGDIVVRGNITVASMYQPDLETMNGYDYIIVYEGLNIPQHFITSDLLIVGSSAEKAEMKVLKRRIELENMYVDYILPRFIYRDRVNKKISTKAMCDNLGITPMECYEVPFNADDYSCYVCLTQNGYSKLKHTSDEMQELIVCLGSDIFETSEKQMTKYFKR